MDPLTALGISTGANLGGNLLASLFTETQQVAGPTYGELKSITGDARNAAYLNIQKMLDDANTTVGAQASNAGQLDSGAAIAALSRTREGAGRQVADLEANLASEFIRGLSMRQFAPQATPLSVIGETFANAAGPLLNYGASKMAYDAESALQVKQQNHQTDLMSKWLEQFGDPNGPPQARAKQNSSGIGSLLQSGANAVKGLAQGFAGMAQLSGAPASTNQLQQYGQQQPPSLFDNQLELFMGALNQSARRRNAALPYSY